MSREKAREVIKALRLVPENPSVFDFLHALRGRGSRSGDDVVHELADMAMDLLESQRHEQASVETEPQAASDPSDDWITHRQPTSADGDSDHEVAIPSKENHNGYEYVKGSSVKLGEPWQTTKHALCYWWNDGSPNTPPPPPKKKAPQPQPYCNPPSPKKAKSGSGVDPWITDRPPTAKDGDIDGDVAIYNPATGDNYGYRRFDKVRLGEPWMNRQELLDGWIKQRQPAPHPNKLTKKKTIGWITDRAPTSKDVGSSQTVAFPSFLSNQGWVTRHWATIDKGHPWQKLDVAFRNWGIDSPAPKPTMDPHTNP